MSTTLIPPLQWAQDEFGFAELGDRRRNKRLVKGVLAPHWERTRNACRQPGEYLLIEDTTLLDYSNHPATQDLGMIGDGGGRGFELHSALAVRIESWTLEQRPEGILVGLFGQPCRTPRLAPPGETRGQRLRRPRKSQSWAAAIKCAGRPANGRQWIYVADRESDFYEPRQICRQHGVDFVIRACQDRRLADEAGQGTGVGAEHSIGARVSFGVIDCGAGRGRGAFAQHQNAGSEPTGVV